MDRKEYREVSHRTWEAMAPGWGDRRDWVWEASRAIGERMVGALHPRPGQTILELAAGAGDTGFAAAVLIGDEGRLISTDFSPNMVEVAERRGRELGVKNAEFRSMDAESMDLGDDSVDGVLCRWGYMLMANPAKAFAETRRVLRPGGHVSFGVVGDPERNPWASVPGRVMVEKGHVPAPEPNAPGIFSMASRERIEELVTGAGFDPPRIEEVAMEWEFDDFDDFWGFLNGLAGGIAMAIAALDEAEREDVRESTRAAIDSFAVNGGYRLSGLTLTALAS